MDQITRWTTRRLFLQHAAAAGMGLAFGSRRAVANASGTRAVFPGDTWQRAKPESQGVDPAKLQAAVDFMDKAYGPDGAKELVIIRNGYLIWEGPQADAYHPIWSCTKTFTGAVLGLLVDDRQCTLDTRAVEREVHLADQYPLYSRIKLRHLASMCGGYKGEVKDVREDQPWGDPMAFLNPQQPLFEAGTTVQYNDHDVFLLGKILTLLAREPLQDVFQRRIAGPIGMTRWEWGVSGTVDGIPLNNPPGNPGGAGAGGIKTTARELARFGLLYLNRGNWNGRQLLSPLLHRPSDHQPSAGQRKIPQPRFPRPLRFLLVGQRNHGQRPPSLALRAAQDLRRTRQRLQLLFRDSGMEHGRRPDGDRPDLDRQHRQRRPAVRRVLPQVRPCHRDT